MASDRISFDVVVVGAGNAALCAALSARDQGASVAVLEKAPPAEQGGNCPFTGGGFRFVHEGIDDIRHFVPDLTDEEVARTQMAPYTADDFRQHLTTVTHGDVDAELMEALIAESRPTVEWMHSKGVRWELSGRVSGAAGVPSVIPNAVGLNAWQSGPGLVRMLTAAARRAGITVLYETEMVRLVHGNSGVVGVEARGFIFGAAMALHLGKGFVPIRKPNKLPARTCGVEYELEYGTDRLEVHADAVKPGQRVLMVDDLLATGGTMKAACDLIGELRGQIVGIAVLIELTSLSGREKLTPHGDIHSVITF